jgi:hypothetical protein
VTVARKPTTHHQFGSIPDSRFPIPDYPPLRVRFRFASGPAKVPERNWADVPRILGENRIHIDPDLLELMVADHPNRELVQIVKWVAREIANGNYLAFPKGTLPHPFTRYSPLGTVHKKPKGAARRPPHSPRAGSGCCAVESSTISARPGQTGEERGARGRGTHMKLQLKLVSHLLVNLLSLRQCT